ncbi:hypothetical protein BM43_3207 [Burkholderia gladioli]|uniref:head-tail joining protein n=1 Tax=Burkholderia gladioli TaxID=28095 RepID=UPI0005A92F61|nr:hypothetical protein [Burkholderia gladioli]AJW99221.1 hypothetical protein BM43_3207 [Burkholderia gladioli]ASD79163.1 hypothetical protein CEJ98_09165 [Burkholderia gladioli pv. gladioli]AWY55596.1 hypothetical protein A8H28_31995 [Burkholderia gladioli pv. gladioli]SPU87684.1 Uncharacterised protein [Burkholderia gladioli]
MIDFDGTLNAAISAALGDQVPIIYLPQSGTSVPVLGIFTLITDHTFGEDGTADANITVATLGLQVSQLPSAPQQSDRAQVGAVTYVVKDVAHDGLEWAYLDLGLI